MKTRALDVSTERTAMFSIRLADLLPQAHYCWQLRSRSNNRAENRCSAGWRRAAFLHCSKCRKTERSKAAPPSCESSEHLSALCKNRMVLENGLPQSSSIYSQNNPVARTQQIFRALPVRSHCRRG